MIVQTTFLDAIQTIPGDTPGEKYQKISQLVSCAKENGQSVSMLLDSHQLPSVLGPYFEVEAARILKNHHMVAEALKSEDCLVIQKALSIKSFFDGSDSEVTNPNYLFKHLIPHVTLNTRFKIIKNLSCHLKAPHLAEEFFDMFYTHYSIEQAIPLLVACSQEFTYSTVIEKNIVLPRWVVKRLYRRNPHLVIRYFKAVRKNELLNPKNRLKLNLEYYSDFIAKFVKIDIESFVEIVESYEGNNLRLKLSNKLARLFMKKGKNYLLNKPTLYIDILPLKVIDIDTISAIFPNLLPERCDEFQTNNILNLLQYFPKNRKWSLLEKSYADKYNRKLLENIGNISPELMLILPADDRIRQAKILVAKISGEELCHYEFCWRCYDAASEVIPMIMKDISKASQIEKRKNLIGEIIYCCRVNDDDSLFLDFLKYFTKRHKNENVEMLVSFFQFLNEIYGTGLNSLSSEHWGAIDEIIRRVYVKYISNYWFFSQIFEVLEASTLHKLLHNLSIEENIEFFAHCNLQWGCQHWNILVDHPEYEEKCLRHFIDYVTQKIDDPSLSNKRKEAVVAEVLNAIYKCSARHLKHLAGKTLSISNYPRLMKIVIDFLNDEENKETWIIEDMRNLLKRHDGEVYSTYFKKSIVEVESGEALTLLKREPASILENWKLYLSMCKHWRSRNVIRFIKTVRWHNIIPVKWLEECEKNLTDEHSYLGVLGILLDGPSFVKLVEPFMPKQTALQTDGENARTSYLFTSTIPSVCNLVNPPVPLNLITRYFEGDYLSDGLRTSKNLCRRTAVSKVIPFLTSLTSERVSVKKHVIRLYYMVGTIDDSCKLLLSHWQTEIHHSIREVLFQKVHYLFLKHPTSDTYILLKQCIESFTKDDYLSLILLATLNKVPNNFVVSYVSDTFGAIEKLKNNGLNSSITGNCIVSLLESMDSSVCDILPEPYCMEIIKKYLFDDDNCISQQTFKLALDSFIFSHKQKSERRLTCFVKMLNNVILSNWDRQLSKNLHYYSVNQVFYQFVETFCNNYTKEKIDLKLVELILGIFRTTLDPGKDLRSYLYLIYTRELLLSTSIRDFALRIGCEIKQFIKEFSELIIYLMSETMRNFLKSSLMENIFIDAAEKTVAVSFIEGLLEDKNVHSCFMAVDLLDMFNCSEHIVLIKDLVDVLLNCEHPLIHSLVRQKMNSVTKYCFCKGT